MQGATDGPQRVEGAHCTGLASRDADQADHLAFELAKAHEIEGVFEHPAVAAVVDRCAQDDAMGLLHSQAQTGEVRWIGAFIAASIAEW